MKYLRILALMLAMLMCLSVGFAEEDDSELYDAVIMSGLDVDTGEWILSADLRAMLAVIMDYELYCNEDFDTEAYGFPTVYVNVPDGFDGLAVGVMYFYTDAELVISATYIPILGQYSAFQSELSLSPAIAMSALDDEDLFTEYYEVTTDEYQNALILMADAIAAD